MTRQELLIHFVKERKFRAIAEIGAAEGWTTKRILQECDLGCFIVVERSMVNCNEVLYDIIRETDEVDSTGVTKKPLVLMRMESVPASEFIADGSLDLVFIDAGHGYDFVVSDIQCWLPKVRIGGIICGHDWDPTGGFKGVVQAVEEAFPSYHVENDSTSSDGNHVWWLEVTEEVVESVDRWTGGFAPIKEFDIGLFFKADLGYRDALDLSDLPEALRQEFRDNGVVISDDATLVIEHSGLRWLLLDGDRKYPIVYEDDHLGVYNILKADRPDVEDSVIAAYSVVAKDLVDSEVPADSAISQFFERRPLLRGFSESWKWLDDVNHCNPYYSPLYYIVCCSTGAKHILEIGCEKGYSSYMLASAAKENGGVFYCVEKSSVFVRQLRAGLVSNGFPHVLIWADSKDITEFCWAPYLDFVLLDGDHSLEAVRSAIDMIYPKLRPGSYVALHDIYAWSAEGFDSIVHDPAYNFEYLTFPHNYGLALLRRREDDWEETMRQLAATESKEPEQGWMHAGKAPTDGRVVVVSTTLPDIPVESMSRVLVASPEVVVNSHADGAPVSAELDEPVSSATDLESTLHGVPTNLREFVIKVTQRDPHADL